MKTYEPSSAKRLRGAHPMPVEPPVMTAVLPWRSAMLFAPRRDRGQVVGAVPCDRRARRVQGGELGRGQGDRQRAKVLLDTRRPPGAGNRYRGHTEGLGAVPQPDQRD